MKKFGLLILVVLFLAGCGKAAKESEFWEHSSMFKNWDHWKYSWSGYKKPTLKTGKESVEQGWWGKAQEVNVDQLKKEYNPTKNPEE
ncbi:MAG: hypothetical protein JRL30_09940 [Deltaproteobacteria bacterium]|jgi:hypothetical protein|nr:hypothetical protein [Deltaproteobacteria bacterium]